MQAPQTDEGSVHCPKIHRAPPMHSRKLNWNHNPDSAVIPWWYFLWSQKLFRDRDVHKSSNRTACQVTCFIESNDLWIYLPHICFLRIARVSISNQETARRDQKTREAKLTDFWHCRMNGLCNLLNLSSDGSHAVIVSLNLHEPTLIKRGQQKQQTMIPQS